MRTKIKGSCTRLYLNSPIFWMMVILLIYGSSLKSLPREKFQFWLIWFSASIKSWQLSQNVQNLLLNVLEIPLDYWECSLRYYSWRNCILSEDTLKSLCWKIIVKFLLSLVAVGPTELPLLSPAPSWILPGFWQLENKVHPWCENTKSAQSHLLSLLLLYPRAGADLNKFTPGLIFEH